MSERILELERRIQQLESQVARSHIGSMPYVNTRLARAVAGPSAYPASGNTFYIQLLDGSYSRAPGSQTPTFLNRQASATAICHNVGNTLPDENQVLQVFEWNGYWWCDFDSTGTPPAADVNDFQQWTTLRYWLEDDDSAPVLYPDAEVFPLGSDPQIQPRWNATAANESATLFTNDQSYDAHWTDISAPVVNGPMTCQIAGTYLITTKMECEIVPRSPSGTANTEFYIQVSNILYKNGSQVNGDPELLLPAKRGNLPSEFPMRTQYTSVHLVSFALNDTFAISPFILRDYVNDDWGLSFNNSSCLIQKLQ